MMEPSTRRERPEDMDAVQVCVRIRPLSSREKQEQTKSCIRMASSPMDGLVSTPDAGAPLSGPQQLIVGKDRAFTFDTVLGVTSSQEVRLASLKVESHAAKCVAHVCRMHCCVTWLRTPGHVPAVRRAAREWLCRGLQRHDPRVRADWHRQDAHDVWRWL